MRAPLQFFMLTLLAFNLSCLAVAAGEAKTAGKKLSDEEADQVLKGIFERAAKVRQVQATMVTTKVGGLAKSSLKRYAEVKFEAPMRAWMLSRDNSEKPLPFEKCSLTLFDGEWLWELEPEFEPGEIREASRRDLGKNAADEAGGESLAVFLVGANVETPEELRKEFASIECEEAVCDGRKVHHFTLTPKETIDPNKKRKTIDLWFGEGEAIPAKIKTTEKRVRRVIGAPDDAPVKYTIVEEIRELLDVKTNLDGLKPFPDDAFVFPYKSGKMEVRDDVSQKVIPEAELLNDLEKIKAKMIADRKKPVAAEKQ